MSPVAAARHHDADGDVQGRDRSRHRGGTRPNRVAIAEAKLPQDVTRQGLIITKQSPDLVDRALISPDGSRASSI